MYMEHIYSISKQQRAQLVKEDRKQKKKQYQCSYKEMRNIISRHISAEKPRFLFVLIAATFILALIIAIRSFKQSSSQSQSLKPFLCSSTSAREVEEYSASPTPTQLLAILHYATSRVVPQQSRAEISISFNFLQSLAPCNFLVFGLGHDSLMWTSLNPHGKTLFLEEDPKWVQTILRGSADLRASVVRYSTRLSQADKLLSSYKQVEDCMPPNLRLEGNTKCKLALSNLPDEVYNKEWDIIMIDAPRGYFAEAPGRMGAIYTAAVMSRARSRPGVTHVFLHDVNRRVEKIYAEEFLCRKYMVEAVGRLWHFEIPAAAAAVDSKANSSFC